MILSFELNNNDLYVEYLTAKIKGKCRGIFVFIFGQIIWKYNDERNSIENDGEFSTL